MLAVKVSKNNCSRACAIAYVACLHLYKTCITFTLNVWLSWKWRGSCWSCRQETIQGCVSFKQIGASDPTTAYEVLCRPTLSPFPSLLSHLNVSLQMTDASCGQEDLESSYIISVLKAINWNSVQVYVVYAYLSLNRLFLHISTCFWLFYLYEFWFVFFWSHICISPPKNKC